MSHRLGYPSAADPSVTRLSFEEALALPDTDPSAERYAAYCLSRHNDRAYPGSHDLQERIFKALDGIPWASFLKAQLGCILYGTPIGPDDLTDLFIDVVIIEMRDDVLELLFPMPEFKLYLRTGMIYILRDIEPSWATFRSSHKILSSFNEISPRGAKILLAEDNFMEAIPYLSSESIGDAIPKLKLERGRELLRFGYKPSARALFIAIQKRKKQKKIIAECLRRLPSIPPLIAGALRYTELYWEFLPREEQEEVIHKHKIDLSTKKGKETLSFLRRDKRVHWRYLDDPVTYCVGWPIELFLQALCAHNQRQMTKHLLDFLQRLKYEDRLFLIKGVSMRLVEKADFWLFILAQ